MTPLARALSRRVPGGVTALALALIYAAMLVLCAAYVSHPQPNMIYLDVGKR
jgi:hypothetical protein